MRRLIMIGFIALILFFFIYPSAFLSPKNTLPDDNDTRLIAYIINQIQLNLINHKSIFYGTYFAPFPNTLTYSDLFLTSAILTLPARIFTNNPIIIFNLALILGFTLTFVASYLLFSFFSGSRWLGLIAAILFNLSGFHLTYLPHLQMFSLWPVFLSLYFFVRGNYFLFFLAVTAQVTESIFPVYLIFFSCLILFLSHQRSTIYNLRSIISHLILFLPLWLLFLFPYLKLHYSFPEAVRPIRDAAHFSLGLEKIFSFHSWTLICLFIISIFLRKNNAPSASQNRTIHDSYFMILIFSIMMSLGPVLKIFGHTVKIFGLPIPLPYAFSYYLLPGFNGFRTPSRFIILATIAAIIIISQKIGPYFQKFLPQTKFFLLSSLILLLALENHLPRHSYPVNIKPPSVYQKVRDLPDSAIILELPIKLWVGEDHEIESVRSLYSLEHQHRRVGGYSGFAPLAWINLVEHIITSRTDPEVINQLKSLGVTHIVENNSLTPLY